MEVEVRRTCDLLNSEFERLLEKHPSFRTDTGMIYSMIVDIWRSRHLKGYEYGQSKDALKPKRRGGPAKDDPVPSATESEAEPQACTSSKRPSKGITEKELAEAVFRAKKAQVAKKGKNAVRRSEDEAEKEVT
jgi:hypothetical protein